MRISDLLEKMENRILLYQAQDLTQEYERIELLDGKKRLANHVLYLGTYRTYAGMKNVVVESCALLLLTDTTYEEIDRLPPKHLTECTLYSVLTTGELFNQISRAGCTGGMRIQSEMDDSAQSPSPEEVWEQIRRRQLVMGEDIRNALGFQPEKTYIQLLLIRGKAAEEAKRFFPDDRTIRERGGILIFREYDRQPFSYFMEAGADRTRIGQKKQPLEYREEELLYHLSEGFLAWLAERGGSVVIGNASRDCSRLLTMHQILHQICWLVGKLGRTGPLHTIDEYGSFVMIHYCVKEYIRAHGHQDIFYLVHPALIHIARYDAEHGTDLRQVLYSYLLSGENVQRTAELLYMHRNTVLNKLKKISEIITLDFTDGLLCQRLLFSCQILEYAEKILNRKIV